MSSFTSPAFYSFKPFFTLQPVAQTREKQLKLWRELIISYYANTSNGSRMVDPFSFPLFRNDEIERSLNRAGIESVVDSLIDHKFAEWEDSSQPWQCPLLVYSVSIDTVASEIMKFAEAQCWTGGNSVNTMYEIMHGEEYLDSPFKEYDKVILHKALHLLQGQKKIIIIEAETIDAEGYKFL